MVSEVIFTEMEWEWEVRVRAGCLRNSFQRGQSTYADRPTSCVEAESKNYLQVIVEPCFVKGAQLNLPDRYELFEPQNDDCLPSRQHNSSNNSTEQQATTDLQPCLFHIMLSMEQCQER